MKQREGQTHLVRAQKRRKLPQLPVRERRRNKESKNYTLCSCWSFYFLFFRQSISSVNTEVGYGALLQPRTPADFNKPRDTGAGASYQGNSNITKWQKDELLYLTVRKPSSVLYSTVGLTIQSTSLRDRNKEGIKSLASGYRYVYIIYSIVCELNQPAE